MTAHHPRQDVPPGPVNGTERTLQESIAHLPPLQRQRAIELHRQQVRQKQRPAVQASLSTFTACRARSRFLNLRDSVKKSPTKSTNKVQNSSRAQIPWVPFAFTKVPLRRTLPDTVSTTTPQLETVGSQTGSGGAARRVWSALCGFGSVQIQPPVVQMFHQNRFL